MKPPALPDDEAARLRVLTSYRIVDTAADPSFDDLASLTAELLGVPIALVSIVDASRQWFKARHGLDVTETDRAVSFCGHAVASGALLVVPDARADERFRDNPLVTGAPHVRFYAGAPLRTPQGHVLGTLCAIDREPRTLDDRARAVLERLARQVVDQLERHRQRALLEERNAALRASERRLQAVLETMDEGLVVQDRSGAITECNTSAERILGLTRDQLMGRTSVDPRWRAIRGDGSPFPGETHPASVTLRTGQPSTGTLMGVHKTAGELTWIRINARVVEYQRDGSPASVLTTFHDVTEQHEATAALAAERAFLAALLEHLPGSFLAVIDGERRITRVFGHEKLQPTAGRALVGEPITVLGGAGERRALLEAAAGALEGHPMPANTSLDGAELELVFVPLPGEAGQAPRALAIGREVTERNRLREGLARHERLVTTGTLAAGVGHEINNPLSYVVVNLALAIEDLAALESASPSEALREVITALTEASEGAERIRNIVRGLRTFAREQSVPVATDLADTVELSVHMAMHELRPRAIVLQEHAPAAAALADKSRLSQALVQLLMNAAQAFADANPARNQVRVRTGPAPDGRVSVEVTDNGPGIAPDVLPRIFDPFFTTRPVGQGTGLGLSIAHNLVSDLGGELRVRTRVGEGTSFEILLPATPAAPVVTERPASRGRSATRGRLLLIDDEPNVLAMMERLLRADHDCVGVTDPREAMRHLDADPHFDVVFCDLMMPHIDGMQVYERIRARHPALLERVVFVTGGALGSGTHADFLDSIPNACIDKPFDPEHLRAVARRFVRTRG